VSLQIRRSPRAGRLSRRAGRLLGARTGEPARAFCQASAPSFNVTTEADVFLLQSPIGVTRVPRRSFAHQDSGEFVFDERRICELRRLTVEHSERCSRCFAKYNCAADCPAKRLYPGSAQPATYRCSINRRLTQDQLEEVLLGATDTISLLAHEHGADRRGIVDRAAEVGSEVTL
jgi:uncharacterized protein